jgi:Icc protein
MSAIHGSRRHFLKTSAVTTLAAVLPRWVNAEDVTPGSKLKLRYAVASDLHYGQRNTPFEKMAEDLVGWINTEKDNKGLDGFFFNGDLSNDSSAALLTLRDKHLSKLKTPYYTIKGNHDFVDGLPDSPTESWEKLWGYPHSQTW